MKDRNPVLLTTVQQPKCNTTDGAGGSVGSYTVTVTEVEGGSDD